VIRSTLMVGAALALVLPTGGAAHAERRVVVNGMRLSAPQIQALEAIRCGPIPNGSYWLDTTTGIWGYADDPRPQGHIKDACYGQTRRPSLSERGLLFSPRDFID
jgi:hypothetical protein